MTTAFLSCPVVQLPVKMSPAEAADVMSAYRDYLKRHRRNDFDCRCALCAGSAPVDEGRPIDIDPPLPVRPFVGQRATCAECGADVVALSSPRPAADRRRSAVADVWVDRASMSVFALHYDPGLHVAHTSARCRRLQDIRQGGDR